MSAARIVSPLVYDSGRQLCAMNPVITSRTITGPGLKARPPMASYVKRAKAAEKEQDALELALKLRIGDAEALLGADGKPLCTWKTQASARIDSTRLKTEAPELYKTYTKTTTSRVLRLKGEK